jgi:hypothetical protein
VSGPGVGGRAGVGRAASGADRLAAVRGCGAFARWGTCGRFRLRPRGRATSGHSASRRLANSSTTARPSHRSAIPSLAIPSLASRRWPSRRQSTPYRSQSPYPGHRRPSYPNYPPPGPSRHLGRSPACQPRRRRGQPNTAAKPTRPPTCHPANSLRRPSTNSLRRPLHHRGHRRPSSPSSSPHRADPPARAHARPASRPTIAAARRACQPTHHLGHTPDLATAPPSLPTRLGSQPCHPANRHGGHSATSQPTPRPSRSWPTHPSTAPTLAIPTLTTPRPSRRWPSRRWLARRWLARRRSTRQPLRPLGARRRGVGLPSCAVAFVRPAWLVTAVPGGVGRCSSALWRFSATRRGLRLWGRLLGGALSGRRVCPGRLCFWVRPRR